MRLLCPSCAAEYEVADAALAPGRAVRCARCAASWVPVPAEAPPAPPVPAAAPIREERAAPLTRLVPPPATDPPWERGGSGLLWTAWIASLVLLLALGAAAYVWREDVVRAWPPSARAYAALGLMPHEKR